MNWIRLKLALSFTALSMMAVLLTGCFSDPNPDKKFVFPGEQPGPVQIASNTPLVPAGVPGGDFTKLRAGDLLTVSFSDLPPPGIPEQRIRVPQDGMVTLPYNVKVRAAGKTTTELQDEIRTAYVPQYYVNLTVNVKAEDRFYYVGGEVRIPNRQLYLGDMTVLRAIDTAGGFTDFANRKKIELRRANGETQIINWFKVRKEPKLDPPVFPNDQITVLKSSL